MPPPLLGSHYNRQSYILFPVALPDEVLVEEDFPGEKFSLLCTLFFLAGDNFFVDRSAKRKTFS